MKGKSSSFQLPGQYELPERILLACFGADVVAAYRAALG